MAVWLVTLLLIGVILVLAALFLHHRYSYFARRGILHEKPVLIYGNTKGLGKTQSVRDPFRVLYEKYKKKAKYAGFYFGMSPNTVLFDLDLIKQVMIKDFQNFANRGNYYNEADDPITAHLFNLDGQKWRNMRTKLTPTFTALKMHQMLPIVVQISDRLVQLLGKEVDQVKASSKNGEASIEIKDWLARFTTDGIGSCAFGLDCNSLEDPNAEFRAVSRRLFTERRLNPIIMGLLNAYPSIGRKLHIKVAPKFASDFYTRVVKESIDYRDKNNVKRNDFLNILMEMREGKDGGLTFNQILAQAFVFLLAGFETSSSTMGFALYELATNQDVQDKAREEVKQVLAKHGELNYEAIKELKYMQQVFYETMRLWPILPILFRQAEKEYPVPGTNDVFEAGTHLVIPVEAIQHDPEIYPDPEKFDPERFTPEAVEQRHAMAWLPFGSGPRNCIGARFGEMQSIVGLATLVHNFKFVPSIDTQIPLKLSKTVFLTSPEAGIKLDVQKL
ncbi:uncharacterized protein Dwil_GK19088 [Drosophila willistoni]|nr:uncharacterized protein Dwil_GK19088 [Drosophila willistoni]